MCLQHGSSVSKKNKSHVFVYYMLAITLAIFSALSGITVLQNLGTLIADLFINMFKCISLPIIATSIIVTFIQYSTESSMSRIWRRTLIYTLGTTIVAASVACILYLLIKPENMSNISAVNDVTNMVNDVNYFTYLTGLIPTNFITPFLEHKVISVLLLSVLIGISIRSIKNIEARSTVISFFKGIHEMLLFVTTLMVKVIPIGLYGFVTVTVLQLQSGVEMQGLAKYIAIVVLANLVQGLVILPIWLKFNGVKPFTTLRGMLPALSVAFFSKSSTGTLPITIETVEKNIGVNPKISKFVLPLCTSINMNGCAAFIFVTVMYVMQNHGIELTFFTMLSWIFIATLAAIGNAGIPMGCFFLSASLLAGMNVPITILGLILPLYSLIDMLETALNVWSDACVTKVIDYKENRQDANVGETLIVASIN